MVEFLRIATKVGTPLALAGLIAVLIFYAYSRRLKSTERKLALLPESARAKEIDIFLTRYGISGANLTRDQKFQLIRSEMEKRHSNARNRLFVAAAVLISGLVIVSMTYCFGPSVSPEEVAPRKTSLIFRIEDDSTSDPTKNLKTGMGSLVTFSLSNPLSGLAIIDDLSVEVLDTMEDKYGNTQSLVSKYNYEVILDPEKPGRVSFASGFKYSPGEVDKFRLMIQSEKAGIDYFIRVVVKWFDAASEERRELTSEVILVQFPSVQPARNLSRDEFGRLAEEQYVRATQHREMLQKKVSQR